VVDDVRNGLVSVEGALLDYGVVISDREGLVVDELSTAAYRLNAT
jgi:N-methylhydantoinase B